MTINFQKVLFHLKKSSYLNFFQVSIPSCEITASPQIHRSFNSILKPVYMYDRSCFLYNDQLDKMRRVGYIYNEDITNYHFSKDHPMKTKRIAMANSLIVNYDLYSKMDHYVSKYASRQELELFHDPDYVSYLEHWVLGKKEDIVKMYSEEQDQRRIRDDPRFKSKYKVNESFDCPGFEGLYNFCQLAVGGSIDAADLLISGAADIAINWAGGFHHAKKIEASGFCYVNDIVVCILELLKNFRRVLYLDIDVHHGDGVEEAFFNTNRVMTVSFHEYEQDFFPGTGSLEEVGEGVGKYFTVNVPLKRGMDDITYNELFKKVMSMVMDSYRPDAMVIQCGADSLAKDKLGHFNMSIKGHAECLKYMMTFGVPMVLLGGGGYTIENVSRCWAYETGIVLGEEVEDKIPETDSFFNSYETDNHKLHFDIEPGKENLNNKDYVNNIIRKIAQHLRQSQIRPSLAFHHIPKQFMPEIAGNIEWKMIDQNEDSLEEQIQMPQKFHKKNSSL